MRKISSTVISENYDKCPKHDIKTVIGDMSAQIGRDEICHPTIRNQRFHQETNDNGRSFATFRNMVMAVRCLNTKMFIN
jgi:hypothetical protein